VQGLIFVFRRQLVMDLWIIVYLPPSQASSNVGRTDLAGNGSQQAEGKRDLFSRKSDCAPILEVREAPNEAVLLPANLNAVGPRAGQSENVVCEERSDGAVIPPVILGLCRVAHTIRANVAAALHHDYAAASIKRDFKVVGEHQKGVSRYQRGFRQGIQYGRSRREGCALRSHTGTATLPGSLLEYWPKAVRRSFGSSPSYRGKPLTISGGCIAVSSGATDGNASLGPSHERRSS
jgi:hypothetical protein